MGSPLSLRVLRPSSLFSLANQIKEQTLVGNTSANENQLRERRDENEAVNHLPISCSLSLSVSSTTTRYQLRCSLDA